MSRLPRPSAALSHVCARAVLNGSSSTPPPCTGTCRRKYELDRVGCSCIVENTGSVRAVCDTVIASQVKSRCQVSMSTTEEQTIVRKPIECAEKRNLNLGQNTRAKQNGHTHHGEGIQGKESHTGRTHRRKQAKGHDTPPTVGQGSRGAGSEAHEVLQAVLGPNDREAVLRPRLHPPPPPPTECAPEASSGSPGGVWGYILVYYNLACLLE